MAHGQPAVCGSDCAQRRIMGFWKSAGCNRRRKSAEARPIASRQGALVPLTGQYRAAKSTHVEADKISIPGGRERCDRETPFPRGERIPRGGAASILACLQYYAASIEPP